MTQDRLTVLHQMRPTTSLDAVWTPEEQELARERILADRTSGPPARPARRRRAALAGVLAAGLVSLPGVAGAVGSGMTPQAFFDAYDYWGSNPEGPVDPATATRAATAAGPFGGTFSVLRAENADGLTCLTPVFETASSARAPLPDDFEGGFSSCGDVPSTQPFGVDGVEHVETASVWVGHAGDAVTAEVRAPGGEVYPVVRVEGRLFGWFPLPRPGREDAPTLVGFDADGTEVGRTVL